MTGARMFLLLAPALGCAAVFPMREETTMKMRIDVKGDGPPLVLVGGGLTGWASWEPFQTMLAGRRQVVRAQPLSVQAGLDDRRLPADYAVKTESRALAAALEEAGLRGPVDLVAWSYGAMISLDHALDAPERVRTLTLIEPPAIWVLEATGRLDERSRRESEEMRALYAAMTEEVTEEQLATFLCQAGFCPPGKSPRELPQWPVWVQHRRSLRLGDAVWRHRDSAARLRAFDRPVLLVKGQGSSHFLHAIIDALAATLPRAQVLELPGGHAPHIVTRDEFLERLAAFQR